MDDILRNSFIRITQQGTQSQRVVKDDKVFRTGAVNANQPLARLLILELGRFGKKDPIKRPFVQQLMQRRGDKAKKALLAYFNSL